MHQVVAWLAMMWYADVAGGVVAAPSSETCALMFRMALPTELPIAVLMQALLGTGTRHRSNGFLFAASVHNLVIQEWTTQTAKPKQAIPTLNPADRGDAGMEADRCPVEGVTCGNARGSTHNPVLKGHFLKAGDSSTSVHAVQILVASQARWLLEIGVCCATRSQRQMIVTAMSLAEDCSRCNPLPGGR